MLKEASSRFSSRLQRKKGPTRSCWHGDRTGPSGGPIVGRIRRPAFSNLLAPRLHPSPRAAHAVDGRGKGGGNRRSFVRLPWLRWRCTLVRAWEQVLRLALPVCGLGNPAVTVLPHIGERVFQFCELRFEQLRDALWHAVLVRCRLRWWQWRENPEQFHGLDVPASVVVARRTDASGFDGAEHGGLGNAGGGRGGSEIERHCGRLRLIG